MSSYGGGFVSSGRAITSMMRLSSKRSTSGPEAVVAQPMKTLTAIKASVIPTPAGENNDRAWKRATWAPGSFVVGSTAGN